MDKDIKKQVREAYGDIARTNDPPWLRNYAVTEKDPATDYMKSIGYTDEDLELVPDEANLGLGCGNPIAFASLKKGEIVLDLGSGSGFDAFLAARAVGEGGRVIGVDMTQDMLQKAEENARKCGFSNVEFRFGEIENLPVEDNAVDVVISNCVINLSPDKEKVFKEAYRVLRPGGRLMVSDIVVTKPIPKILARSMQMYAACVAGAVLKENYLKLVKGVGFEEVTIVSSARAADFMFQGRRGGFAESIESIKVSAKKPDN